MIKFVERFQMRVLLEAIDTRRVLLLNGPRQCGKTTLAQHIKKQNVTYRTLDDIALLKSATIDPHGFIKNPEGMMIIDEVQRAPFLLQAIKKAVDENNRSGQYLLTGSANINALPSVQESLAGRVQKIRLRTLAQAEIEGSGPTFLHRAFAQEFNNKSVGEDKEQILKLCFRGGFPEAIQLKDSQRRRWHEDYINAILERDLREISNIHKLDVMKALIKIVCSWSGKFMDVSAIGAHLSIRRPTLESYLNSLEILYLIERLPPWTKTDYQRIGRQSKLFVTDCGLICSLLRWQFEEVFLDSDRSGKIIETFVYNELVAQVDANDTEYALYHYRDRENREIDFLIERSDGAFMGIEVKAGSNVGQHDFKHLMWFRSNMVKDKLFIGIVLYTGEHVVPFGNNLWAIPCSHLWKI
jgi:predicted AAA+ superfamily ATPase